MNEQKIDALQIVLNSEVVMTALMEVFVEAAEKSKPKDADVDDVVLGQKYRAYIGAKTIVADVFVELQGYQKPDTTESSGGRHV